MRTKKTQTGATHTHTHTHTHIKKTQTGAHLDVGPQVHFELRQHALDLLQPRRLSLLPRLHLRCLCLCVALRDGRGAVITVLINVFILA